MAMPISKFVQPSDRISIVVAIKKKSACLPSFHYHSAWPVWEEVGERAVHYPLSFSTLPPPPTPTQPIRLTCEVNAFLQGQTASLILTEGGGGACPIGMDLLAE